MAEAAENPVALAGDHKAKRAVREAADHGISERACTDLKTLRHGLV